MQKTSIVTFVVGAILSGLVVFGVLRKSGKPSNPTDYVCRAPQSGYKAVTKVPDNGDGHCEVVWDVASADIKQDLEEIGLIDGRHDAVTLKSSDGRYLSYDLRLISGDNCDDDPLHDTKHGDHTVTTHGPIKLKLRKGEECHYKFTFYLYNHPDDQTPSDKIDPHIAVGR
jgi:hypothetical protein